MKNIARLVLIILTMVVLFSVSSLDKLKMSFDLEKMFPDNDDELGFYMNFRKEFEPDNDFILIGLKNVNGIFNLNFLSDVKSLSDSLKNVPFVQQVLTPVDLKKQIVDPLGVINIPYLHYSDTSKYDTDSVMIYREEKLLDVFFARNAKSLCINVITEKGLSKAKSDSVLAGIHQCLSVYNFDEVHMGGRIPSQAYVINKMGSELAKFMSISFLILLVVLFLLYRSFLGVVLPLIIVIFSTIILLGIMVLMDEKINIMLTILPVVMFIVGTSDVIHVLSRYTAEKVKLNNWKDALSITFKEVGLATFLTSFTTAIGFVTLITASIQPVQRFGLVMAIGVMVAYFVTFLMLPALLYLIGDKWNIMQNKGKQEMERLTLPIGFIEKVLTRKKTVLLVSCLLVVVSILGINRLEVNNYLLDDLRDSDPHKMDFYFFEHEFSGVRPFEIALFSEKGLFDYRVQQELEKLHNYLDTAFGAMNLVSPYFFVKNLNQSLHGGNVEQFRLNENEMEYEKDIKQLNRIKKQDFFKAYVSGDEKEGRISAKIKDEGRIVVGAKIKALNQFVEENIDPTLLKIKPTGTALLIDKNAEHLAGNMLQGLLVAFLVISVIVSLMFKSVKMIIVSLIPNVLPLLMIAGFMGWVGIDLKASTIIIFTISFGIAVDDTIHFLSKLKLELSAGRSMLEAVKNSYVSTGKAIVITSLILFVGFAALMFSTFQSTYYIGLLISLTLLFAVLADLILLPVLIISFYKK